MNRKVLIVNGGIWINGNTDALITSNREGSANTGLKIKLVTLREKTVANCVGCYQ
jgi:multimeric flavodoxin WrbA